MPESIPPVRCWHRALRWLALPLVVAATTTCGEEITDFDSLYLVISADKTPERIARLDFDVANATATDQKLLAATDNKLKVTLPAAVDIATAPFRVQVKPSAGWSGTLQVRILGYDAAGKAQASFNGTMASASKAEVVVRLSALGAKPDCDADGDGVPKCTPQCQIKGAACDCLDDATPDPEHGNVPKGKLASPFLKEDACLDAGDGIDQDCDGADLPKKDSDGDTDPDCIEQQKCPTVEGKAPENNPDVSSKAIELCDGIDNNCDGKIDDGLDFVDIDGQKKSFAKGDECGSGACAGGKVDCAGDKKSLVCTTAGKKNADEACDNKVDDDCDGQTDEGCAAFDIDGDGVANCKEVSAAIDPKCKGTEPAGPCKYKFAAFHSEYHPGANEPCCPAGQDCSGKEGVWDFNCDGKVVACAADDPDGDGQTAAAGDCEPTNPEVFSGSKKQKCGDGKGPCPIDGDVPCSNDKDGDLYNADVDCNDGDKAIAPFAPELCNGIDDDCDGLIDEGNPGGNDDVCGDKDGDCGLKVGVSVCKHFVAEGSTFKPDELDCLKTAYKAAIDGKTGICVGCYGDNRPAKETCDDKDNDCDAITDEDFAYDEEGTKKQLLWGQPCDGIGTCGAGVVQCGSPAKTICSTDPGGKGDQAMAEACDNKDNNCNGKTDENLTLVSDSKCQKLGVCAAGLKNIETVCVSGQWRCNYGKVLSTEYDKNKVCAAGDSSCQCEGMEPAKPSICYQMKETSCDALDNDCDGSTDEDFDFTDWNKKSLKTGSGCGTGACAGGKVVCEGGVSTKGILTCDTLIKVSKEKCNAADDDCDGSTDELAEMPIADSTCLLVGVCTKDNVVHTCPAGKWNCNYGGVKGYEEAKEINCDGLDNDCDGQTDEDFDFKDFDGKTLKVSSSCGTGVCKDGKVVCTADKKALTCSTLVNVAAELCDYKDNDCDGSADEDFKYTQEGGKVLDIGQVCDGIGQCAPGLVECTLGKTNDATCSTDPDGSKHGDSAEKCNDLDDDCDKTADEGCDVDKDQYCTTAMETVGTPKSCPKGGKDCDDDPVKNKDAGLVNPGAGEQCDYIDNNCSGQTDEVFSYKEPTGAAIAVGQGCGLGECAKALTKVTCLTNKTGTECKGYLPQEEICDNKDNDCDGQVDEGCDKDGDKYCDAAMKVAGIPLVCPLTKIAKDGDKGDDCNDDPFKNGKLIHAGAAEVCDDIDNNCSTTKDEGCDDDGDDYCDSKIALVGTPGVCPKGGSDCNDDKIAINPGALEICDEIDNNCNSSKDEGCDDDGDKYCDSAIAVIGIPTICSKTVAVNGKGDDCNDGVPTINPAANEICDDIDNNCNAAKDEGCDKDSDLYCDGKIAIVGTPAICPKGGNDCNDSLFAINPSAAEICDDLDNNCNTTKDEGCDDDNDKFCDSNVQVIGKPAVCQLTNPVNGKGDDCNDDPKQGGAAINANAVEICDDIDNNCSGLKDEGCDDDGDKYCDAALAVVGKPAVCPNTVPVAGMGDDCNDAVAQNGIAINPGKKELCGGSVDDNCNGKTDEEGGINCTDLFFDNDKDGYGVGTAKCLCKVNDIANFSATAGADCVDTDKLVFPGQKESCSTTGDDNCNGDNNDVDATGCKDFFEDKDSDTYGSTVKKCFCQAEIPSKFTALTSTDCNDDPTKGGASVNPGKTEICNDIDDNCASSVDEGCDDDADDYCDSGMTVVGKPATCKQTDGGSSPGKLGNDCNDAVANNGVNVNPGKQEQCNDIDDNCAAGIDENCDQDGDDYCTSGMVTVGTPAACPKGGNDCNDLNLGGAAINPSKTEICDDIDNDCAAGIDNGCDDDNDDYCDTALTVIGKPITCSKTDGGKSPGQAGNDCNDNLSGGAAQNPGKTEICDDIDNDCAAGVDNGCDNDNDDYCDTAMTVIGKPNTCSKTDGGSSPGKAGNDCNDNLSGGAAVNPGKTEVCDSADTDCNGTVDDGCDDDNDDYCDSGMTVIGKPTTCSKTDGGSSPGKAGNDCNDSASGGAVINLDATEVCDSIDNNCKTGVDEGCDDDDDDYCDSAMTVIGKPTTCSKTDGGSSPGKPGNDCLDAASGGAKANPGLSESCDNVDNDCSGGFDENCDKDNDNYCDANLTVFGTPTTCTLSAQPSTGGPGNDCNDDAVGGSSFNPGVTEVCNGKDDDCKSGVDNGVKATPVDCSKMTKGVCTLSAVETAAKCESGAWVCNYQNIAGYECDTGACKEITCTGGIDNNCDGAADSPCP